MKRDETNVADWLSHIKEMLVLDTLNIFPVLTRKFDGEKFCFYGISIILRKSDSPAFGTFLKYLIVTPNPTNLITVLESLSPM